MVLTHLFFLLVTEFSYLMYRKNAVYNGKQEQMKWATAHWSLKVDAIRMLHALQPPL